MQDISGIAVGSRLFVETSDGELLHATLCAYDAPSDLVVFCEHLGSSPVMRVMRPELVQRVEVVAPASESYLPQGPGPFGGSQLWQAMLSAEDSCRPDFLTPVGNCDASHAKIMLKDEPFDIISRMAEGKDAATDAESWGGVVNRDIVEQMPAHAQSRLRSELSASWSSSSEAGSTQRGSSDKSSLRGPYVDYAHVKDKLPFRSGTEDLPLRVSRTSGGRRRRRRSSFNQARDDVREFNDVRDLSMAGQWLGGEIQKDSHDVSTASPEFRADADVHSMISFEFPCWDEEEEEEREHRKEEYIVDEKRSFERVLDYPPLVSSLESTGAQFRNDTKTIERSNLGFRNTLHGLDRVTSFEFPCWDEEEEGEREHRKDKHIVDDKRSFERVLKDPPWVSSWERTAAQFRNDTKTIERNSLRFHHTLHELDSGRLSLSRAMEQHQADRTELIGYLMQWPRESDDRSCALQPPGSSGTGRPDGEGWGQPKFGEGVPVAPTHASYLPQGPGRFHKSQLRQAMLCEEDSHPPDALAPIGDGDASHVELASTDKPLGNVSRVVGSKDTAADAEGGGSVVDQDIVEYMPAHAQNWFRSELSASRGSTLELGSMQRGSLDKKSFSAGHKDYAYDQDDMPRPSAAEDLSLRVRRTRGGRRHRRRSFNQGRDDVREVHDVSDISMAGQWPSGEFQQDAHDVSIASPELHTNFQQYSMVSNKFPCCDVDGGVETEQRQGKYIADEEGGFKRLLENLHCVSPSERFATRFRNQTTAIERRNLEICHTLQRLDRVRLSPSRALEQQEDDQTESIGCLMRWSKESDDGASALKPPNFLGAG